MRLQAILASLLLVGCTTTSTTEGGTDECMVKALAAPKHIRKHMCTEVDNKPTTSVPGLNFLWNMKNAKWNQDELTVSFLNGSQVQKDRVKKHAPEWSKHCAITFKFLETPDPNADIRISFRCGGHWSYLGRFCRNIPSGKATMNIELGRLDFDEDWRRVVLHEFGHALGFEHEQRHPERKLNMDEPAVLEYYMRTQGWSAAKVYEQVIDKANVSRSEWEGTDWDKDSIMHYAFPAELTTDNKGVEWNTKLSEKDKEHAAKAYPRE